MRGEPRFGQIVPDLVPLIGLWRAQDEGRRGLGVVAHAVLPVVVLQPPLVAAHAHLDLFEGGVEGGMGVWARAGGVQLLARGEPDDAVDVEVVPVLLDHDLGVDAAAFEVPFDAGIQSVGDARAERVPDGDVLAGNLNLHAGSTRRRRKSVKQPPRHREHGSLRLSTLP